MIVTLLCTLAESLLLTYHVINYVYVTREESGEFALSLALEQSSNRHGSIYFIDCVKRNSKKD